jgi:hypothetical protein
MTLFTRKARFHCLLVSLVLAAVPGSAAARSEIFRCPDGNYTNNLAEAQAKRCKSMEGGINYALPTPAETAASDESVDANPSFHLTDVSLSPNVKGVNVEGMIGALRKTKLPTKSEFETRQEFDERIARFASSALKRKVDGGKLAVVRPLSSLTVSRSVFGSSVTSTYDAETEMLSVEFLSSAGVALNKTITAASTYVAVNASGQNFKVSHYDEVETLLMFTDEQVLKLNDLRIQIPLHRTEARRVIPVLAVVLIGSLSAPYVNVSQSGMRPSPSRPVSESITAQSLVMSLANVWIFNQTTGEVLWKAVQ